MKQDDLLRLVDMLNFRVGSPMFMPNTSGNITITPQGALLAIKDKVFFDLKSIKAIKEEDVVQLEAGTVSINPSSIDIGQIEKSAEVLGYFKPTQQSNSAFNVEDAPSELLDNTIQLLKKITSSDPATKLLAVTALLEADTQKAQTALSNLARTVNSNSELSERFKQLQARSSRKSQSAANEKV